MTDYEFGFLLKLAAGAAPAAEQPKAEEPPPIERVRYNGNGIVEAGTNVDYYLQRLQQASQPAAQPAAAPAAPAATPAAQQAAQPAAAPARELSTPWFDPNKPISGQDKVPDFGGDALYDSAYRARQGYEQALARNPDLAGRFGSSDGHGHWSAPEGGEDPWVTPARDGPDSDPFGGARAPAGRARRRPGYRPTPQMGRMSDSFDALPVQRQMRLMRGAGVGDDEWLGASGAGRDELIRRAYRANQDARERQRERIEAWRNAPGYVNGVKLSPAMLRARGLQ